MKTVVHLLCGLLTLSSVSAIERTAASGSLADVQAKLLECEPNDTLVIPACTVTPWAGRLTVTIPLHIRGEGVGVTNIEHNFNGSELILFSGTLATDLYKVTGISFTHNASVTVPSGSQTIHFTGLSQNCVIGDCTFLGMRTEHAKYTGATCGVVYNCTFSSSPKCRIMAMNGNINSSSNGDGAWEVPSGMGTAGAVYVEDCVATNTSTQPNAGIVDSWIGGRVVVRNCTLYDLHVGNHGTESSQRLRSGRFVEAYRNTMYITIPGGTDTWCDIRGGTSRCWGNTILLNPGRNLNSILKMNAYRSTTAFPPWGFADGTKDWDTANLTDDGSTPGGAGDGVFEAGTADTSGTASFSTTAGITASLASGVVTASASVFTADMVGRYLQFAGSSTKRQITGYTSDTVITVGSPSGAATNLPFQVGSYLISDSSKSWGTNQWATYSLRFYYDLTATSGGVRSITVSGANWAANQWAGWEVTKESDNTKGVVLSNTATVLTLRTDYYPLNMTGGGDFRLSLSRYISSSTTNTLNFASDFEGNNVLSASGQNYEIRRLIHVLDQAGLGETYPLIGSPVGHQDVNQVIDPVYQWLNTKNGTAMNEGVSGSVSAPSWMANTGVWYSQKSNFAADPDSGMGVGTAAEMNAISPSVAGVGYWVTDEGEWDSTNGATPDGRQYVANGSAWVVNYTPFTYPHPLRGGPDVTPPEVTSAILNGNELEIFFPEAVLGGAANQFALSGGLSLSNYTGTGNSRRFTVTPPAAYGATITLSYTQGDLEDNAGNLMESFSGSPVTNSTPDPGLPSTRNPGRKPGSAHNGRR